MKMLVLTFLLFSSIVFSFFNNCHGRTVEVSYNNQQVSENKEVVASNKNKANKSSEYRDEDDLKLLTKKNNYIENQSDNSKEAKTEKKALKEIGKNEKNKNINHSDKRKKESSFYKKDKIEKVSYSKKQSYNGQKNKHKDQKDKCKKKPKLAKKKDIKSDKEVNKKDLDKDSSSSDGKFVNGKFVLSDKKKKEVEAKAKKDAQNKIEQEKKDGTFKLPHNIKLDTLQTVSAIVSQPNAQQDELMKNYKKAGGDLIHGHVLKAAGEAAMAPVKGLVTAGKASVNSLKKEGQLVLTAGKETGKEDIKDIKDAGKDISHGHVGKAIVDVAKVPVNTIKTIGKVVGTTAATAGKAVVGVAKKIGGFFKKIF